MTKRRAAIPVTKAVVGYIARYGGACRDCADENGVCPNSGLPCGGSDKAIRHVLNAYNYGAANGYLATPEPRAIGYARRGTCCSRYRD